MPTNLTKRLAAKKLREAANLINEKGFITKGSYVGGGGFCALGALNKVLCGNANRVQSETFDIANSVLKSTGLSDQYGGLEDYNDDPTTTAHDVVTTLRKGARNLEHGAIL